MSPSWFWVPSVRLWFDSRRCKEGPRPDERQRNTLRVSSVVIVILTGKISTPLSESLLHLIPTLGFGSGKRVIMVGTRDGARTGGNDSGGFPRWTRTGSGTLRLSFSESSRSPLRVQSLRVVSFPIQDAPVPRLCVGGASWSTNLLYTTGCLVTQSTYNPQCRRCPDTLEARGRSDPRDRVVRVRTPRVAGVVHRNLTYRHHLKETTGQLP